MKDMQAQLEKLQVQAAECELIRDLATDPRKRELFTRLAQHFKVLAAEVEKTIAETKNA
jgi:predicted CopG family antitoxin